MGGVFKTLKAGFHYDGYGREFDEFRPVEEITGQQTEKQNKGGRRFKRKTDDGLCRKKTSTLIARHKHTYLLLKFPRKHPNFDHLHPRLSQRL